MHNHRATNISKRAFLASNVSSIIYNQVHIQYKDLDVLHFIVIHNHNIHNDLLNLGSTVNLFPQNI